MKKSVLSILLVAGLVMLAQAQQNESNIIRISAHKPQTFSEFATQRVKRSLDEWAQKGEFEKTADWQLRVNETTCEKKKKELILLCQDEYIKKYGSLLKPSVTLGRYDADNETYMLTDTRFGQLLVPVPMSDGPAFKQNWKSAVFKPQYFIEDDTLALASLVIEFPALKKRYEYSSKSSLRYEMPNIAYNFGDIKIDAGSAVQRGRQTVAEKNIAVGRSKVDTDIPQTSAVSENTFALIIANENYKYIAQVPFALNDGRVMRDYCHRTLGIPEKNIHLIENATFGDFDGELTWLERVCSSPKYKGVASVIFYYTGHGIPDDTDKSSYILPTDNRGNTSAACKLDELYSRLGAMPAKSVTVLLDACFSGANRDGEMLAQRKGVAIKARKGEPQGNTVVFSAAQGNETAGFNRQEGHGLFTYYLLRKLQQTQGNVTLRDLSEYVIREVTGLSAVEGKLQTPEVTPAPPVADKWEEWKLR